MWVWEILFWPPTRTYPWLDMNGPVPVVVTVRFMCYNPGLLPEIFDKVVLRLVRVADNSTFELDPYAFMEADAFTESKGRWIAHQKERFRPLVIKARSEAEQNLLFVPVGEKQMATITPGTYRAVLRFSRVWRRLSGKVSTTVSDLSEFTFDVSDSSAQSFSAGDGAFGYLLRDVKVQKV